MNGATLQQHFIIVCWKWAWALFYIWLATCPASWDQFQPQSVITTAMSCFALFLWINYAHSKLFKWVLIWQRLKCGSGGTFKWSLVETLVQLRQNWATVRPTNVFSSAVVLLSPLEATQGAWSDPKWVLFLRLFDHPWFPPSTEVPWNTTPGAAHHSHSSQWDWSHQKCCTTVYEHLWRDPPLSSNNASLFYQW